MDFQVTLEKAGNAVNLKESHRRAMAKLRDLISDGCTTISEAYSVVNARLVADVAKLQKDAIAKSAVDSSNAYSRDFFVFEPGDENRMTASQVLEGEDRARTIANVQAIRDAVASMPSNFDETSTGISVTIDDWSTGQRVSSIDPQRAAALHEQPYVWPMDLASDTQRADADQANVSRGLESGFAGSFGGPATRPNATDGPSNFSKSAVARAQRVSERRDRDR
jgi:hypothetical protein